MKINFLYISIVVLLLSCNEIVPRRPVSSPKISALDKTVLLNKRLFAEELILMEKFMQSDSLYTYINSQKGFWYAYVNEKKDSRFPLKGDEVFFEQEIIALNGTIIYAKKDLGLRKYVVDREHAIKGIKEGIKIMREGEEIKFLFSSFVAFRMNGDASHSIGSNEPFVNYIKLVKINN